MTRRMTMISIVLVAVIALGVLVTPATVRADPGWYVVRSGDTLYSIARRYGVSVYSIASANCLANPNYIRVGQVLRIPGGYAPAPKWEPPVVPAPWHPAPVPVPVENIKVVAWTSQSAPPPYSTVTVTGRITSNGVGVAGVPMVTTWHYRSWTDSGAAVSGAGGVASSSRYIGAAPPLQRVSVTVAFLYKGKTYSTSVGFTPQ